MQNVLLIRYGEIHLKGLNRPFFERKLLDGIKRALPKARVERAQGRFYALDIPDDDMPESIAAIKKVFGVHSVSPALAVEKDFDAVAAAAVKLMGETLAQYQTAPTFKVEARRADKNFRMKSDEINRELGHILLETYPQLNVDVHHPQIHVGVEIREQAYVYTSDIKCQGGMPTGSSGRGMLLISGGIDSPVAGYMMGKRGLVLSGVHFYSYPYTSERARDKVVELTRIVSGYCGDIKLHLIPFTEIQLAIYDKCPPKETTLIMRRLMMRIAERLAVADEAQALITGEALGQVASQTLESLAVTDDAVSMPVFRPLIGFDKDDIVDIAKRIDTFETSIQPYEDCCTVFVPQHPTTKPEVARLRESEALLDFEPMIETALQNEEVINVYFTQSKVIF